MPNSAEMALGPLLKEGTSVEEALAKLEEAGFAITPPEGDESYGSPEGPEAGPPEAPEGEMPEGAENPGSGDRRMQAVESAMKQHGYE